MLKNDQNKKKIIQKFAVTDNDSGSSNVQIALFTDRIKQISSHLQKYPKDNHSRLGLVKLVGKRKALLNYLKRKDKSAHNSILKTLKN